ncbi:MAG: RNA polymerase sigma factor [Lachnospiraceae bacterium]|nr:RNA polymerase sigma factor [Lachnospiraceae bacterium]
MNAFEEVYLLYFDDVYRFALSLCGNSSLAEEIAQETFFKAFKKIDTFDGRSGIKTWLFTIAKNVFLNNVRFQKRFTDPESVPEAVSETDPLSSTTAKETTRQIYHVLHLLPDPYKEVFLLRYSGDLSFADIGDVFGKSESWARVTYHRARQKIKEALE